MKRDCPECEHPLYWHGVDGCGITSRVEPVGLVTGRRCSCRRTRDGDPTA